MRKRERAEQYSPQQILAVRAACFGLVSAVGDLLDDVVIVGGLVPSLLVPATPGAGEAHVGTLDVDVGLQVGVSDRAHYHRLAKRLREHGFAPSTGQDGEPRHHRWVGQPQATPVDFLIAPQVSTVRPGAPVRIDRDLEAVVTPGLRLAFRDRERVPVDRWWPEELRGGPKAGVLVCGPGAFVLLKALAFHNRQENKDAYDPHWLITHYGRAVEDVGVRVKGLLGDGDAQGAVERLRGDFGHLDAPGPRAVAAFLLREDDDGFRADVAGAVGRLIAAL